MLVNTVIFAAKEVISAKLKTRGPQNLSQVKSVYCIGLSANKMDSFLRIWERTANDP